MNIIMKNLSKAIIILMLLLSQSLFSKIPENAITVQPLGLLTIRTSIEYERYIGKIGDLVFSLSGRMNFSTQKLGVIESFDVDPLYFTTTWWGVGTSGRFYFDKEMNGLYLGINLDNLTGTYREYNVVDPSYSTSITNVTVSWMGVEIGDKFVISGKHSGFIITPSVGFIFPISSVFYINKIIGPTYSLGVAVGYQF